MATFWFESGDSRVGGDGGGSGGLHRWTERLRRTLDAS